MPRDIAVHWRPFLVGDESEIEPTDELLARAVKFTGKDTIEGLAMPYGVDTDGETFTPKTDFCLDWYGKSGRPFIFEHGLNDDMVANGTRIPGMKSEVIGRQTDYEQREEGIWATVQLERNARYRKAIDSLIERGALGYSAGAMPHLAKKNARQEITRFPWVELSGTPIPANHRALDVHYVKSSDFIARLEDDATQPLKAALAAMDEWASRTDDDSLPDGLKFADLVDRLSVDGPAWIKARHDWHLKSGRVLSAATRDRLTAHPAALRQLADDLDELLANADTPKDSKSADLWVEAIQTERTLARLLGVPLAGEPIQ